MNKLELTDHNNDEILIEDGYGAHDKLYISAPAGFFADHTAAKAIRDKVQQWLRENPGPVIVRVEISPSGPEADADRVAFLQNLSWVKSATVKP